MEKKLSYIAPTAEIVRLNLTDPIQQDGWEITSGEDETLGRENRGSFFDEDEADDGGYKKFQLWDSADSN
jgi:hypothetical protein